MILLASTLQSVPRPPARALGTLLAAVALAGWLAACGPTSPRSLRVGDPIPEFELRDLDGARVSSRSYRGTPVVLNFWATWCRPCVKEIPTLRTIEDGDAARVVSIALDEEGAARVQPFVDRHGIEYTVLLGDMELFQRFDGYAIPYTLVLDSSLRIVKMHRGYISLRTLERDLQRARTPAAAAGA